MEDLSLFKSCREDKGERPKGREGTGSDHPFLKRFYNFLKDFTIYTVSQVG